MSVLLYDRLGGTSGITQIVHDALEEHMNNPAINARFLPLQKQPEYLEIIKKHTIEFFSAGSGGPVTYAGKDMLTAHIGMNISSEEFMHVIDDIFLILDKHKIDEDSKKDVLAILWSLKGMIISN
jgi:hemoglobin